MVRFVTPFSIPLYIASGIALVLTFYGLRNRQKPTGRSFTLLMAAVFWWSFGYAQELSSQNYTTQLLWAKLQYVGIVLCPVAWVFITSRYASMDKWLRTKRPYYLLTLLTPITTLILVWTNEKHGLIWSQINVVSQGHFQLLDMSHGWFFWVHSAYSYGLIFIGTYLITRRYFQANAIYRLQTQSMLIAIFLPWISNLIYLSGLNPFPALDLTPFAFVLSGVIMAVNLFRYSFLKITPAAYDTIVQQLQDPVFVLDAKGLIIEVNGAGRALWPEDKTDVIGQSITKIPVLANVLSENEKRPFPDEITIQKDGQTRHYELSIQPIRTHTTQDVGQIVVLHDITLHKEQTKALQKAKETAESAAKAKSQFLANISHEIRTPLNAVVGMGSLLAETELTGEQKELLDTVVRSSDQLLAIINNLLDYSQMESGALQLEKRPFSLRDCLNSSVAIITPEAIDKGLKITTRIPENLHDTYIGDAVRLRQILINLLQNAVKFTEEGSVTVEANYHTESQQLQINVIDTGIGIPPEKQIQIFSSFGQIDDSMTRKHGGLGLGLAISSHLCQLMGGEITVKSEIGKGAHFSISIPIQQTQTETPHRFANTQPSLRGKRILIIAPNTQDRRQIALEIRKAGTQTYVAGSIQEGLFWLKRPNAFDAAILDSTLVASEESFTITQIQDALQKQHIPLIMLENSDAPYTGTQLSSPSRLTAPITAAQVYNVLIGALTLNEGGNGKQPNATAVPPTKPKTKASTTASKANMAAKHPLKILLVEDNIINQKVATKLLQNLSYQPDIANNGKEGLEKLNNSTYDVVLMDIQMPVMDGLEATAQIHKQFPPEKRPIIVALTAHAVEGDREYYLSQGMDAYLSKPIQVNALIETLYNCKPIQGTSITTPPPETKKPAKKLSSVPNESLINLDMLQKLMGDSAETFLADALPGFYIDAEIVIAKIQASIEKNEWQTAKLAAGRLKNMAATLGMQSLAQVCQQIETAVNSKDISMLKNTAASLQQIFQAIKSETARFLQPN
ncbi:MAG: hypothetical protein Kow0080_22540 [Candidatus Promineifilaceae bacterium]